MESRMPTIFRERGYRFFFFSNEGAESPHVHVEQGERYAKFWLEPVALENSRGFRSHEIHELYEIIRSNREQLKERWHGHFGDQA